MENKVAPLTKKELGKNVNLKGTIKKAEKIIKTQDKDIRHNNFLQKEAVGYLEAEGNEETLKFRQQQLKPLVPIANAKNMFDLDLEFGHYKIDYSRNGKMLALAGSKGHVSILDWRNKELKCEFQVKETTRDIKFLNNELMFAVAQKKYLYIYDGTGMELHRLKSHPEPLHLEYLPYHYLLVSLGQEGSLIYHDISTGKIVAEHKTKVRDSFGMALNPYNGVICVADPRGQVSMWIPNTGVAIVKMQCHDAAVTSAAVDFGGKHLVTTGGDGKMKVWDIRTYKLLHEYWTPQAPQQVTISQTGLLAVCYGIQLQVWKDWQNEKQKKPYMKHDSYGQKVICDMNFVPYEDFLGLGLSNGFSNVLIPGSGEPNFDSFEVNIFETSKQRRENEVSKLLDKLPADTITLDPTIIGTMDKASKEVLDLEKKKEKEAAEANRLKNKKKREKTRGRSTSVNEVKKKESVHDEKTREKLREIVMNKIKVKKIEKQKIQQERDMLREGEIFEGFDPIASIKKVKKL